jgi:23S rRNA (guanosine2251-2'-O)-methyltransferase
VEALLANPQRIAPQRILATDERGRALAGRIAARKDWSGEVRVETVDAHAMNQLLPQGAVHQGAAILTSALPDLSIDEVAEPAEGVILMLDEVTDPQNVGAILRSAAAFNARAVVVQDRRAPEMFGALAKAAAGALERTPVVRVVNLSRALERLQELGWTSIGLSGQAEQSLEEALPAGAAVLVLGSEGEGLRRLVSEHCDTLAKIDMPGGFESLNVSAAAAVALYAASTRKVAPA